MKKNIISYALVPTAALRIRNSMKPRNNGENMKLYLTFDDGPDFSYTPELLDLLKKNEIKATFFMVADFAQSNPEIVKRIKDEGHQIALHSLEHKCMMFQDRYKTMEDISSSLRIMKDLEVDVDYFRPPWGIVNLTMLDEIKKAGMELVLWDVMAEDWRAKTTPAQIERKLARRAGSGSIICLHDGRGRNGAPKRTIKALEKMIPRWKAQGYTFAKIEEYYNKGN